MNLLVCNHDWYKGLLYINGLQYDYNLMRALQYKHYYEKYIKMITICKFKQFLYLPLPRHQLSDDLQGRGGTSSQGGHTGHVKPGQWTP